MNFDVTVISLIVPQALCIVHFIFVDKVNLSLLYYVILARFKILVQSQCLRQLQARHKTILIF